MEIKRIEVASDAFPGSFAVADIGNGTTIKVDLPKDAVDRIRDIASRAVADELHMLVASVTQ